MWKFCNTAIAEHAWAEDHPINWSGTKITMELVMKEALCIQSSLYTVLAPSSCPSLLGVVTAFCSPTLVSRHCSSSTCPNSVLTAFYGATLGPSSCPSPMSVITAFCSSALVASLLLSMSCLRSAAQRSSVSAARTDGDMPFISLFHQYSYLLLFSPS